MYVILPGHDVGQESTGSCYTSGVCHRDRRYHIDDVTCVNNIEILNWVENIVWSIVPLRLPFPMYALMPIISNDNLYIVGFSNKEGSFRNAYLVPAASIASPLGASLTSYSSQQT